MCILLMKGSHQPVILTHRQAKNRLILFYINTNFTSIYRYPTCYQNNPSCIDHIVTNSPKSFFKTETVFTGLSDFHELFLSVFRLHFSKAKAKEISYRSFRDFKRIIGRIIGISRIDFQQNLQKNMPLLKKFSQTL